MPVSVWLSYFLNFYNVSYFEALLSAETPIDFEPANNLEDFGGFAILDSSYVLSPGSSLSNTLPTRNGLMIYRVQSGDNLSSIAANFGVSLNTVFWANPNLNKRRSIHNRKRNNNKFK